MNNLKLMSDEIDWINENMYLYHCTEHKNAVICNIKKRYKINELNNEIKKLTFNVKLLESRLKWE